MHRIKSPCTLKFFCFARYLEAKTKVTLLFVAAIIAVILIMDVRSQHGQNVDGMVQSNDYNTNTVQTEVDIRNTLSLLPLPLSQSQDSATSNLVTVAHGDIMAEGNTSRDATIIELASQHYVSAPPQQITVALTEIEVQEPELKTELKVSCWVVTISAGGIISVLAGLPGNEKAVLTHQMLFKSYTYLTYASLIFGVGLFLLTHIRPNIEGLVILVQINMWMALVTITYAIGFGTCILLPKSPVSLILVLVVPLVLIVLAVILIVRNYLN